ncbi:hypothetical protein B0H14DRAFT_3027199, partial [Mycena olivaceomarginata]
MMKSLQKPPSRLLPLTALPTSFHPAAAAIPTLNMSSSKSINSQARLVIHSRYATLLDVVSLSKLSIQSSLFKTCKSLQVEAWGPQSENFKRQAFHHFNLNLRVATMELCGTPLHQHVCYIFSSLFTPPFPVPV